MKMIRIWFKGKRIGAPYDEYSLKVYSVFVGKCSVVLIPKNDSDHVITVDSDFLEKVEVF